jgi:hypothetical protein
MAIATFADGVPNVLLGSAQKEVIHVATAWPVATMQNPQSVWNGTTVNLPRKSVSAFGPATMMEIAVVAVISCANK